MKEEAGQQQSQCCAYLTIEYYQPFFDVSQEDVIERVKRSFTPWKKDFLELSENSPDLYGPAWVYTTIIFLLASVGNLARYFSHEIGKEPYAMRLDYVRSASIVIYGVGFAFPVVLALMMKFFGSKVSVVQVICIYGYSFSCFVAILLLCVVPWGWLHWILIVYGILNSSAFLLLNLETRLPEHEKGRYIVLALVAAVQLTLLLVFKLKFFDLSYNPLPPSPSNSTLLL
jgi:hypothetical protein